MLSKQPKQNWSQALLELEELEALEEELELEELDELEEELELEELEELDEELELEELELDEELEEELPQFCALEHVSTIVTTPRGLIILPICGVNTPPVP